MGNLTCIFESYVWNLESQKNPSDLERRRSCGKWRYKPYKDWVAPDPLVVFDKLPNEATIYMMGDSIGTQASVDLLCYLASVSKVVNVKHSNLPPTGGWCRKTDECKEDTRGMFSGLSLTGATFQSYDKNNTKNIHVKTESGNMGAYNKKSTQSKFKKILSRGKKDDIYVINQGMHYGLDIDRLVAHIHEVKDELLKSKDRGARVLWRETSASHFDSEEGSHSELLREKQNARSAECIPHKYLNATKSYNMYNGRTTPLMKSFGIDVLEVWEATFLGPEWCHIGAGVDCAHFLQPGITSYFTESLLKYIEEKM